MVVDIIHNFGDYIVEIRTLRSFKTTSGTGSRYYKAQEQSRGKILVKGFIQIVFEE